MSYYGSYPRHNLTAFVTVLKKNSTEKKNMQYVSLVKISSNWLNGNQMSNIRKFFMLEVIVIISFSKAIEGYRTNNLRKYYVYYDKMKVIKGYQYQ